MIGLHALGYAVDHPVLDLARAGLDSFTIEDEAGRRIEACQSPVWDTALALIALLDAGLAPSDEAIARGARWLAGREVRHPRRLGRAPAGHPDRRFPVRVRERQLPGRRRHGRRRARAPPRGRRRHVACKQAADRGLAWAVGMQSEGGGWGAFDVDNTSGLPLRLPFCDFGAVTDPPSADVTAHMVELLGHDGLATAPAARRGLDYLLREQERDGSWFGRWGANHLYGTGAVVPALAACGLASTRASGPPSSGSTACRTPTVGSARTCARIASRAGAAAARRRRRRRRGRCSPSRGGRGRPRGRARRPLARRDAAAERRLGRAVLHRHRLPGRLLLELPPVPGRLPRDGARPDPRRRPLSGVAPTEPPSGVGSTEPPKSAGAGSTGAGAGPASLLLLAPLRLERAALRVAPGTRVLRTGMGRSRARIAAARALAIDARAVAIAGVCAGVAPELRPGDVVCASELRRDRGGAGRGARQRPGRDRLAATRAACARRPGAVGRRLLGPAEREALADSGALAVDMESAWLAEGAGGRPLAVVRVVADAAGRRLADPRLLLEGARALVSLRQVGGALAEWAAAVGPGREMSPGLDGGDLRRRLDGAGREAAEAAALPASERA